jgi:hypothetical protein
VNIISIGGASRSGSTLLAVLLGGVNGFVAVGELRYIWSRGYLRNELCSCGQPFRECDFWRAVLEDAYGAVDKVPIAEVTSLHRSVAQVWHLPLLMSPKRASRFEVRLGDYLGHLENLCRGISKISGAKTIVDSSKLPSYCYLLSRLSDVDVQLLHLVRDSRAVAFSFMRRRRKPEVHDREEYMRRFSPLRSARDWDLLNVGMELIRRSNVRCDFVRYEDLVNDLSSVLTNLLQNYGEKIDLPSNGEVRLPSTHMVAGNPLRFQQGSMRVKPDSEWSNQMGRAQYYVVTALTLPLLIRYGYL